MKAISDRLFLVHADHAAPAATHDAVARVAALLLECCAERPTHSDLIVDAVMDALAKVRPGWARVEDNDCDDLPITGHAGVSVREACRRRMPIDGSDAQALEGALSMTERERDEASAEVERLRAEVASLRHRPTRDELADYARRMRADDAPHTDEPDDGWEPGPWWTHHTNGGASVGGAWEPGAQVHRAWPSVWVGVVWIDPRQPGRRSDAFDDPRAAMRWCEAQPEMADVIAAYTSAPTVGADGPGADSPGQNVEGDDGTGAREARAVPAAPVPPAEQLDDGTGADRPRGDERIVGPREGQTVTSRANPPYGYEIDDRGDDLVLLTVQAEAAVMLRICEMLDEHRNATEIAEALNGEGHRSRTGTQWTPSSVRARILGSVDEWREVGR